MMADLTPDPKTATTRETPTRARSSGARGIQGSRPRDFAGCTDLRGLFLGDGARVLVLGAVAPDGGFLLAHEGDVGGRGGVGGAGGGGAGDAGGGDVGGVAGRVEGAVGGVGGGGGGLRGGAAGGEEGVVVAAGRCGCGGCGGGGGGRMRWWWWLWEGFVGGGDSGWKSGVGGCGGGLGGWWLVGDVSRGRGRVVVVVVHRVCGVGCTVRMDLGEGSKVAVLAARVGDWDGFSMRMREIGRGVGATAEINHIHC